MKKESFKHFVYAWPAKMNTASWENNRMNIVSKKWGVLKRFLDARWTWNIIAGPIYNRLILKAAPELYERFVHEIQPAKNAQILDVGSGPGFVTIMLARENPSASVVGVDYSPRQVRVANCLRIRMQIHNCKFGLGNAMNLPFEDACFDIVVSVGSIKHWPDGKRGLQEIHRVLIPDGAAFIAEADRNAPPQEIHRFASRFTAWYVWNPFMRWCLRRVVFGQSYSRREAEWLARAARFATVSIEKVSGWPFFLMKLRK